MPYKGKRKEIKTVITIVTKSMNKTNTMMTNLVSERPNQPPLCPPSQVLKVIFIILYPICNLVMTKMNFKINLVQTLK